MPLMKGLKETAFKSALSRMSKSRLHRQAAIKATPSKILQSSSKPVEQVEQQQQPVVKITKMAKLILESLNEKPEAMLYQPPKLPDRFDMSEKRLKRDDEKELKKDGERSLNSSAMFDFDTPVVKNNRKKKVLIESSMELDEKEQIPSYSFNDCSDSESVFMDESCSNLPSFHFIDE